MSDFETTLEQIVSAKVTRDEYPAKMAEYTAELNDIQMEKIPRSATKDLYFARLAELTAAIQGLQKDVVDNYLADLETARKNPVNRNAATLVCLEEDYPPQFVALQTAYNATMILNDTTTLSSITTEYQALLTEYNAKKEAALS